MDDLGGIVAIILLVLLVGSCTTGLKFKVNEQNYSFKIGAGK